MTNDEWQAHPCAQSMPYLTWHAMSEKLAKRRQRQAWCATCERWKWPPEQCAAFVLGKGPEVEG